jgi:hypothetical protein
MYEVSGDRGMVCKGNNISPLASALEQLDM